MNYNNWEITSSVQTASKSELLMPYRPRHRRRARHGVFRLLCLMLACALLGGVGGALIAGRRLNEFESILQQSLPAETAMASTTTPSMPQAATPLGTGAALSAEEIFDLGQEQVVGITTEVTTANIFGQSSVAIVTGTGFIVSADGYILTNYHVIEGASRITARLADGRSFDARLVGGENYTSDTAVLKIEAQTLPAARIGRSDTMRVGARIYAIGNPLGELTHTMTRGIVSALDREIAVEQGRVLNMFQIDAAVNSGNSGGPVYNEFGEVVGIVTAKANLAGVEGIGFAIPIDDAMTYANQLMEQGHITRPYLGIYPVTISEAYAYHYDLIVGVFVHSVFPDTAAARAGMQEGDIITEFGGTAIATTQQLRTALGNHAANETVTVTVFRNGKLLPLQVTLSARPAD